MAKSCALVRLSKNEVIFKDNLSCSIIALARE
jgi:hypothetical protein